MLNVTVRTRHSRMITARSFDVRSLTTRGIKSLSGDLAHRKTLTGSHRPSAFIGGFNSAVMQPDHNRHCDTTEHDNGHSQRDRAGEQPGD